MKNEQPKHSVNKRREIFSFERFPEHPNVLLMDEEGRLFLQFGPDRDPKKSGNPKEAGLVEVLDWFVTVSPFGDGGSGDMREVCELASVEIKRLRERVRDLSAERAVA